MLNPVETQALNVQDCEQEPIHIPGAVQPHGVLLALTEPDLRIVQASTNAAGFLSPRRSVIDLPLEKITGRETCSRLRQNLSRIAGENQVALLGSVQLPWAGELDHRFDVIAHRRDGLLILELESGASPHSELDDYPSRVIEFLDGLGSSVQSDEICMLAAEEVRRLTGFDRVLIYRFDPQWHGRVIAESRNDRLPSYLGHRFPASDIPAQARELYRRNRSRIIPDAQYKPVPIEPAANPLTGRPLDLTCSALRSVSPIHVEYMRNMGTAASMSYSILRGNRLWGLISCHHATRRPVPYYLRRACELIAQVLSLQLSAAERQASIEQRVQLRVHASRLLKSMSEADDFMEGLVRDSTDLLAIAGASGAAVVSQGRCTLVGRTPSEMEVNRIVEWLKTRRAGEQIVHVDDLPAHLPEAARFRHVASGMMAASVSPSSGSYVLWFRPEVVETVIWAGDPNKATQPGSGSSAATRLNPRTSFEAWTEVVRGTAEPWTEAQIQSVTELHADAAGLVLRKAEALAALSAELQRSNRELESFSYSVSHDLRAPFRHIVGYAELLRDAEGDRLSERARRYAGIVIDAARDAGKLIDNLLAFSQMGRASLHPADFDLDLLVQEVQAEVMAAEGAGRKVEWNISPLPSVRADLSMLRLAVRNLLSNAVKYTRDRGDDAKVTVRGREEKGESILEIQDNGVGFDMKYADKLFGVFQRLHRMEEFEGTGIGLANVRRIVERHGGRVWAHARVGEGATFGFALPRPDRKRT